MCLFSMTVWGIFNVTHMLATTSVGQPFIVMHLIMSSMLRWQCPDAIFKMRKHILVGLHVLLCYSYLGLYTETYPVNAPLESI